jgi:nucleotide-binding universal stress UspA family protein
MLRGPVLVGTDMTIGAGEALRQGARLASALGGRLVVCHVMPASVGMGGMRRLLSPLGRGPAMLQSMTITAHEAVSRELESTLVPQDPAPEIVLESGAPHIGLLAQAARVGAGVVVIGPGTVATQAVRHALVPVLVARPSPPGAVVGATDFGDSSIRTMRLAATEARRRRVPLHLVHALDIGAYMTGSGRTTGKASLEGLAGIALDGFDEIQATAAARLKELLQLFDVEGQTAVIPGYADHAIVIYAEHIGAGLVVVGRHERSHLSKMATDGTATGVIDAAPCSVLIDPTVTA